MRIPTYKPSPVPPASIGPNSSHPMASTVTPFTNNPKAIHNLTIFVQITTMLSSIYQANQCICALRIPTKLILAHVCASKFEGEGWNNVLQNEKCTTFRSYVSHAKVSPNRNAILHCVVVQISRACGTSPHFPCTQIRSYGDVQNI